MITTAHGLSELLGNTDAKSNFKGAASAVVLFDTSEREIGKAGSCVLQDAPGGFYTSDVFVFDLPSSVRLDSYTLSPSLPAPGSRVWVISKEGHNFGSAGGADKYAGIVASSTIDGIMVRMDAPLTAYHSSGSPVVDERGNVIGMLVGTANGRTTIGLNPSAAILMRLDPRSAAPRATARSTGVNRPAASTPTQRQNGVQTYGRSGVQTYR